MQKHPWYFVGRMEGGKHESANGSCCLKLSGLKKYYEYYFTENDQKMNESETAITVDLINLHN